MTYFTVCCHETPFIVLEPDTSWMIEDMRNSQHEDYKKLADISLSLDNDWDYVKTDSLRDNEVMRLRTHATAATNEDIINSYSLLEAKHNTLWYRSTETVMSENPTSHWLSKKKWPLSEQLNLHMLNYQEV